jgi:hypothetical protein
MTAKPAIPRPSASLGAAGKALHVSICKAFDLEAGAELKLLELACCQADDIALLERAIKADGVTVTGSTGQSRLNPALAEVRQGRLALAKILGTLALPDEDDVPRTASSRRAQMAANTRWARVERRRNGAA